MCENLFQICVVSKHADCDKRLKVLENSKNMNVVFSSVMPRGNKNSDVLVRAFVAPAHLPPVVCTLIWRHNDNNVSNLQHLHPRVFTIMASDANKKRAKRGRFSTLHQQCTPKILLLALIWLLFFLYFGWKPQINTTNKRSNPNSYSMYNEMSDVRAKFPARKHPRVFYYDMAANTASMDSSLESNIPMKLGRAAKSYPKGSSSSSDDDAETCQPMHDWQTRIFPNCNLNHELSLRPETGSVQFIACKRSRKE